MEEGVRRTAPAKVLAVLDAFDPAHRTLTLSELARRAGLPVSTAHRIVAELLDWGGLERAVDGRLRIGLHLWELAALAPRAPGLREVAMPVMGDLYAATQENVQLAVREGHEIVFVERIAGRHAVPVLTRVGARFPATATGVGLVLLAFAPPGVQEAALAGPHRRFTPRTMTDPAVLRRVLAEVRRSGVAVSDGQVTLDALSVAAPVAGPDGEVVAAVSVVVAAEGADPRVLAPAVRTAAAAITRGLARPTPGT